MIKPKLLFGVSILLLISLFGNLTLGFNLSDSANRIKQLESKYSISNTKANVQKEQSADKSNQLNNDVRSCIDNFFHTQFEYDNATYKARFTRIKNYVNDTVYGQLTSAGIPGVPGIKFENKINELQIYSSSEAQESDSLVLLNTSYTVDKVINPPITQIYRVKVDKENQNYKITSLELIGTFTPMTHS